MNTKNENLSSRALRDLAPAALQQLQAEKYAEWVALSEKKVMGKLKQTHLLIELRRLMARILTIAAEKARSPEASV